MFEDSIISKRQMQDVERYARALADSVGKLLEEDGSSRHSNSQHVHEGCEYCRKMMHHFKDEAHKKWDYSKKMAMDTGEEIDTYARENVWKTVGIAAAVGAALGALLMKRRR